MTGCGIAAELIDFRPGSKVLIMDKLDQLGGQDIASPPFPGGQAQAFTGQPGDEEETHFHKL